MSNQLRFTKMSSDRLQKLLMSRIYNGLCTDIVLESPCFQLGPSGEIIRHVFIGVTKNDFLIAHQMISDVHEVIANPNIDLDLEGLELVCCVPLSMTHFSLWDDRSCKIAVCTDLGTSFFFEMCNLTDGSDDRWSAWREYVSRKDNSSHFGYKSWKVFQSDSDTSQIDFTNVQFLKRPAALCLVESVGTQACEDCDLIDQGNKKSPSITKHKHPYNEEMLQENDAVKMVDLSSQLYTSIPELQLVGKTHRIMQVSSDILLLETAAVKQGYSEYHTNPSRSQTNLRVCNTDETCGKSIDCWKNWIFYMLLQYNSKSATRQLTFLFPNSCLSEDILKKYTKIWRARAKHEPKKLRLRTEISSSLFNKNILYSADKNRIKKPERARYRWRQTVEKTRQPNKLPLSNRVMGVFKTHSAKRLNTQHLEDFEMSQVADELTLMAAELVLLLTEEDLLEHQLGTSLHDLHSLWNLKTYSIMVVRFISKEILSEEDPSDQARVISYCIKVGEHCHNSGNLLTLASIFKSLYSLPVSRLAKTWNVFQEQYEDCNRKLKEMATFFNPVNYFEAYSHEYTRRRESGLAYLPWFDHYRWHLSHVFSKYSETCEDTMQTEPVVTEENQTEQEQMKPRQRLSRLFCICCVSVPKSTRKRENEPPYIRKGSCICSHNKAKFKRTPKRVTFCLGNQERNLMCRRPQTNESFSSDSSDSLAENKNIEVTNGSKYPENENKVSSDNITNINDENSKQIYNTFGKGVSTSAPNPDYEPKESISSEFVDIVLDDSDNDECSIGPCSINSNAYSLDLESFSQTGSYSFGVPEYNQEYKPLMNDFVSTSAQVVTTGLDNFTAAASENHTPYSKSRKSLSKSEDYELAGHKEATVKNTLMLQASRSSPLVSSRKPQGHYRKPRNASPQRPYFEPDITTEGPKLANQDKCCYYESDVTMSTSSVVSKTSVSCSDVVGDLLQIQLAALKYKHRSNRAVREYITKSIPTDFQLLQMSLQSQPTQRKKENVKT